MSRLQFICQMSDLSVSHGQPAGALLQVPLQTGTFPLCAAHLAGQLSGLGLKEKAQKVIFFIFCC